MNRQKGFIGRLILIIIALVLLKYFFDWSIFDAASSEQGRKTISYIKEVFNVAWDYIDGPVLAIWYKILPVWHKIREFLPSS